MRNIYLFIAFAIALASIGFSTTTFATQSSSPSVPEISPPNIKDKTTVALPGGVDDIVFGGGGRYILLQFNDLKKIGVFDVNVAKITHYIGMPDSSSKFAAGLDKVILINGDGSVVSRYDLKTGKRELTSSIDLSGPPKLMAMGSASLGPAIAVSSSDHSMKLVTIDLKLKSEEMKVTGDNSFGFGGQVRVSNNGKTMGMWATSGSPSGLKSIRKVGDQWIAKYNHESVGAILPSADGRFLFTGRGIYSNQLRRMGTQARRNHDDPTIYPVPSIQGGFHLKVAVPSRSRSRRKDEAKPVEVVTLHLGSNNQVLANVEGLEPIADDKDQWGRETLTLEKRLSFIPAANLIVQLSKTNDKLVLIPFDVEEVLKKSDEDFLFVTSQPPVQAAVGSQLKYEVKTLSKSPGVKYLLDSGPKGMTVSKSGTLSWTPKADSPEDAAVIVTISNSKGQKIFHTFDLKVPGAKGSTAQASNGAAFSTEIENQSAASPVATGGKEKTIKLPGGVGGMVVGGGGRFILIHFDDLKKIGLFDVGLAKIVKYFPANDAQTIMAAGANHLVVIGQDQGVISRFNLTTHERELTKTLPFSGPVQYAGMGSNSFGPLMVRWTVGTEQLSQAKFALIDLKTLDESKEISWDGYRPSEHYRDRNIIRATSDGKLFTISGVGPVKISGNKIVRVGGNNNFGRNNNSGLIPSANGKYFVSGGTILNSKLLPVGQKSNNQNSYGTTAIPSVTGQYYLSFTESSRGGFSGGRSNRGSKGPSAKLYMFGDSRPIVNIPELLPPPPNSGSFNNGRYMLSKELFFIPDLKVIVSISPTRDSLVMRRMDIEEALKESGVDYLIVSSTAPESAKLGKPYKYKLDVKSKRGGVKYKLDSGPTGMTISTDGTINWTPKTSLDSVDHKAIVTVSDAVGQEVFHTFEVSIPEIGELVAAKKEAEKAKAIELKMAEKREEVLEIERAAALQREALKNRLSEAMTGDKGNGSVVTETSSGSQFQIRDWIDSTGKHRIQARFSHVEDKSKVILIGKDGKRKVVPLGRLCEQDIFRAVENELKKSGEIKPGVAAAINPFKDPGVSAGFVTDPKILTEVIDSVESHIKSVKSDAAAVALNKIVHPEFLTKLKATGDFDRTVKEFKQRGFNELIEGFSTIDFQKGKMKDGVIGFRTKGPSLRLKKDGDVWKMTR